MGAATWHRGTVRLRRCVEGDGRSAVLFMDYLTCLAHNPPKASIRIIASSSSRFV